VATGDKMSKGKNYVRKGVARHITLSREADEFLRESVLFYSQFIKKVMGLPGLEPGIFAV